MRQKGFFSILKKEVIFLIATPKIFILALVVPIALFLYYESLLEKGVPEKLPVVLLDQDNSQTSRVLYRMLASSPTLDIQGISSIQEGEYKVRTDQAMALIILPINFEKNLLRGINTEVVCYYNGQYLLAGGLISKAFQIVVGTFSAGAHIKVLMQKGMSYNQALITTTPVVLDTHILYNPYTSYSYYLNFSLMPMAFQIIIMVVSIYVLGRVLHRNEGKELLEMGKGNIWIIFWGKVLPYTILFAIIGFFMNSFLFYKIGVPFRGNFLAVNLFFIAFILVCQLLSLFVVSITSNLRSALTLGGGYAAISFSFAGYTFPEEGMPIFIQYLNYTFPFTSYLRLMTDHAIKGINFNTSEIKYIIAFIIFISIGVLGLPKYYKLLKKGGYNA